MIELRLNPEGSYLSWLAEYGKLDSSIADYYSGYQSLNQIGPGLIANMIYFKDRYNFKNINVRLIMAIHYITVWDYDLRKQSFSLKEHPRLMETSKHREVSILDIESVLNE